MLSPQLDPGQAVEPLPDIDFIFKLVTEHGTLKGCVSLEQ